MTGWLVGLTNAYNFIDGMDGIAAGQAVAGGGAWMVVCWTLGLPTLTVLSVLLVGASLGFLPFNLPPARMFMGDVGSTVLGYTFATLPILTFRQADNSRMFIAGVLCVAPFVFDAALTMLRWFLNHENILQAHRSHLYQRLVKLGYSHGLVSLLYTGLAVLSSFLGLVYLWGNDLDASLALLGVILLLLVLAIGVTWLEHRAAIGMSKLPGIPLSALERK